MTTNSQTEKSSEIAVLTDIIGVGDAAFWDAVGGMNIKLTGEQLECLRTLRDRLEAEQSNGALAP